WGSDHSPARSGKNKGPRASRPWPYYQVATNGRFPDPWRRSISVSEVPAQRARAVVVALAEGAARSAGRRTSWRADARGAPIRCQASRSHGAPRETTAVQPRPARRARDRVQHEDGEQNDLRLGDEQLE